MAAISGLACPVFSKEVVSPVTGRVANGGAAARPAGTSRHAPSVILVANTDNAAFFGDSSVLRKGVAEQRRVGGGSMAQQAVAEVEILTESKGLGRKGVGQGGRWLSSATRHIRVYAGVIDPESKNMDQSQLDKLTLMVDPDNEFLWPDDKLQKVYDEFTALVENYAGAPLDEYTLRLIGSDLEHFIRKMLLAGEIEYNLDCRVLNFSMGKPRYEGIDVEATTK